MNDLVALQRTLYASTNPTRRWLHTSRRDLVVAAIANAPVLARRRALEVGPGSGVYLPALCAAFDHVVAMDIEPAHVTALRDFGASHANLDLLVGDLCAAEWNEPFDLVLCSEVIEHVRNPEMFIAGLARSACSGGILIISTPQPWSIMEVTASIALKQPVIGLTRLIYREPVLPTGHISIMSARRLTALLESCGFAILSSQFFGLYLPALGELGGQRAVAALRRLEGFVQRRGPRAILWTQMHVARKRSGQLSLASST